MIKDSINIYRDINIFMVSILTNFFSKIYSVTNVILSVTRYYSLLGSYTHDNSRDKMATPLVPCLSYPLNGSQFVDH